MKKTISIILSVVMLLSLAITGFSADTQTNGATEIILQIDNPTMTVNGVEKEIDPGMGTTPVIINDRTLLPVRAVVEEIGGTVGWNGETQEVTLSHEQNTILLTIDSTTAYLNGAAQILDTAPTIINDRTMLPIRFIVESFGYTVDWDGDTQAVTITKAVEISEPTTEPTVEPTQTPSVEPTAAPNDNEVEENKMLVVYFSATGTTKAMAETVAQTTGADIVEIVPSEPYTSADLNYNTDCRANSEQQDDTARPEFEPISVNIDEYDTIFLGYPIWWGTMPKIINTFLDTYDLSGKTVMPFCTSGGSGISTSVSAIRNAEPSADVKDGMRGASSTTSAQVEEWIAANIE